MAGKFINELSSNPPAPEDLVVFFDKSKATTVQAPLSDVVGAGLNLSAATKGQTAVVDTKVDPISLETIPFLKWDKAGIDFKGTTPRPANGTDEVITSDPVSGLPGKTTVQQLLVAGGIPAVTGADAGKQLTVQAGGAMGWTSDTSDLPVFTIADKGKQLTVKADGLATEWVEDAKELPTIADGGKLLATKADKSGVEWIAKELPPLTAGADILAINQAKNGVEWIQGPDNGTMPADGQTYTLCAKKTPGGKIQYLWHPHAWVNDHLDDPVLDFYPARYFSIIPQVGPAPSFSRASTGSYFDSTGAMRFATINAPRFNHVFNGTSWVSKGLLIEGQRTNLLLNSETLSTQSVAVTNVAHTISFYGTGTVTLSGASTTGPLVGTGASDRVSLTFTPTAGTLTVTVSGSVKWANLEVGAFATSYIQTLAAQATRSADVCQITGSDFSGFWNGTEGALVAEYDRLNVATLNACVFAVSKSLNSLQNIMYNLVSGGNERLSVYNGNVDQATFSIGPIPSAGTPAKIGFAYKANDFAGTLNGAAVVTDTSGTVTAVDQIGIGYAHGFSAGYNGHISRLRYYRQRLPNSQLQELTK